MYYSYYPPYVPVAERRRQTEQRIAKLKKKGVSLSPVVIEGRAIATTFWGKAWCSNLESYSDYENRLPRGRMYARNGSVIDLKITAGEVQAQVMGSSLYTTSVKVTALPPERWQAISQDCAGTIDSLVELLQGRLSKSVMERMCRQNEGLFPAPREIKFDCSCPDGARMCKHVAAVLYGVGARLDQQPELLFTLRRVDAQELVAQASSGLPLGGKRSGTAKVLDHASLADVFGLDMAETANVTDTAVTAAQRVPAAPVLKRKPVAKKPGTAAKKTAARIPATGKPVTKKPAARKPVTKKAPAKKSSAAAKSPAKRKSAAVPKAG